MVALNFDARAIELLSKSDANPDAAAEVLLLAAEYIRAKEPLPDDLAEHLAGAIEASMVKPERLRGKALLRELNLQIGNRRKADVDWYQLGMAFEKLVDANLKEGPAASQIAVDFNTSESTAKRLWKKYKSALKAHQEAIRDC